MEVTQIRTDFPLLSRKVHGKPLVYLDNGATTQKPQIVIDAITDYYTEYNSNIHRGVHHLSQLATEKYEVARKTIQQFIGAQFSHEIIFSPGTTSSINLVASSWGRANVSADDEVLISAMEHHSNIVPWQMLCEEKGAKLKVIPMNDNGELIMEQFESLLSSKTKIVAVNHISNTLGTINPVEKIIAMAHDKGSLVLVDGAQSVAHMPIDVVSLNADFMSFLGINYLVQPE